MTEGTRAARRAADVLDAFYGPQEAIRLPVDPIAVARSLGIDVYETMMPNDVSGLITRETSDADVEIFLNSQHAPVRQRFTCAHEVGHYIDLLDRGAADGPFFRRRDIRSSCGTHTEEIFANRFAAYLLMPAGRFRALRKAGLDEFDLSVRFKVSVDAVKHHLTNLAL